MKSTKKTLLASGLALLACVALLAGTTFAWFTDSVTSKGNKIEAGSLNVSLSEWNKDTAAYEDVGEDPIFDYDRWEPGYTDVAAFKIGNEGTLALKYQLSVIAQDEVSKLAEVIDVYLANTNMNADGAALPQSLQDVTDGMVKAGTLADVLAQDNGVARGHLLAEEADYAVIALHMQENAGNEYQALSIGTTFDVVLRAAQYTYEKDGFGGDQYDADAAYTQLEVNPATIQEALDHLKANTTLVLADGVYSDLDLSKGELKNITIQGSPDATVGTINLLDPDKSRDPVCIEDVTVRGVSFDPEGNGAGITGTTVPGDAIKGLTFDDCTFTGPDGKGGYGININCSGAEIAFKGCTFKEMGYPIYGWMYYDALTVEDCVFEDIYSWAIMPQSAVAENAAYTIRNNTFTRCTGGLFKSGAGAAFQGSFVFTDNTLTECTGHDGKEDKFFEINFAQANVTVSGNTRDGAAWDPAIS